MLGKAMSQSMQSYGWVYALRDYYQMFDLSDHDLARTILDCPGSISSFNAELAQQGIHVVSGDSLYGRSLEELTEEAELLFNANCQMLKEHQERVSGHDDSVIETIFNDWLLSKQLFLDDYTRGCEEGRYQSMALPRLPFDNDQFELALCTDFLALSPTAGHGSAESFVAELCRVAEEVRVYPLMTSQGVMHDALGPVMLSLQQQNFGVEVREVAYDQQVGGNAMLRVWSKECMITTG